MKKTTIKQILVSLCLMLTSGFAMAQSAYHSNKYLLAFEPGTSQTYIDDLLTEFNSVEIWTSPLSEIHLCEVQYFPFNLDSLGFSITITDINEVVDRAKTKAKVTSGGLNYLSQTFYNERGANGEQVSPCRAVQNLDYPLGTHSVRVGVFDTGVAADINDWPQYAIGSYTGANYVELGTEPIDNNGHGTHITGIISSSLNNGTLASGEIEYDIRRTHDKSGQGFVSDIILALDESILEQDINIANMSFSYEAEEEEGDEPLQLAIEEAGRNGVLVIAAAGNLGRDQGTTEFKSYPASFPSSNILSVASVDCNDKLSTFSNWGTREVDLATFGEDILSLGLNSELAFGTGTSQSAAIISKLAVVAATYRSSFNADDMVCAFIQGAKPVQDLNGKVKSGGVARTAETVGQYILGCSVISLTNFEGNNTGENLSQQSSLSEDLNWETTPNPFTENIQLSIQSPMAQSAQIRLSYINGQTVLEKEIGLEMGANTFSLDLDANLNKGIFILSMTTGANTKSILLLKNDLD